MKILKKLFLVFFVFFAIMIGAKAETNSGILYEKYWQEAQVNVFAKDTLTGAMDYNGWMIVSSTDDKVYYCIEPEQGMDNLANAVPNSYVIYRGENITKNSRLTEKMKERVELLAYYGYKYKNHTDKKWYGITQIMIWQEVIKNASGNYKNTTWSFKESRYGKVNNNLYINEINELNTLVNNHGIKPSFNNMEITLNLGESVTLIDTNNALNNFVINSNEYVDVKTNGNTLILTAKKLGEKEMTLTNDMGVRTDFTLYTSNKQDLISRGKIKYVNSKIKVKVTGGELTFYKKDKENNTTIPKGDATLLNSVYEILDENNEKVKEITITKQGMKINLPYGSYKIKEIKAPLGYTISDEIIEVNLNEENKEQVIELFDMVIKGTHIINKNKGGTDEEFSKEQDAIFEVIDKNNQVVGKIKTYKNGVGMIKLPYGKYKIRQVIGAMYYAFVDEYEINIDQDGIEIEVDLNNIKYSKLEFTKTDTEKQEYLKDALIEIYKEDDTLIYKGTTNESGKIELPNLEIGRYYIVEKASPKYYRLNTDKIYFDIVENGKIVKVNMTDEKVEGSLKILKKDKNSKELLKGVKFNIYDINNNLIYKDLTTNEKGEIVMEKIKGGKYYLEEKEAKEGYYLENKKTYFEIEKDKTLVELVIYNEKITNPKTKDKIATYMILSFISMFTLCTIYVTKYNLKNQ